MLIDEIIFELKQAKKSIAKRDTAESDERLTAIREQMESLNDLTPRFNVQNIYAPLSPTLLNADTEFGRKRNEQATEYRNQVLAVSAKAPMCPPWWTFWMEFRYPKSEQRVGVLLRYDKVFLKYVGSLAFDRMVGKAVAQRQYDFLVDAFELLLDPTSEMYGSVQYNVALEDEYKRQVIPALAEVATVFIQLKNYYKKENGSITPLVGQQTNQPPAQPSRNQPCSCGSGLKWKHCHGKGNPGKPPAHPAKPSPETILLLDPFMQKIKQMRNGNGNGTHASPRVHLRSGGWRIYTMQNPLGGAIAWQTGKQKKLTMGKNYGRIYFAPTDPTKPIGDPTRGVSTKRGRVELGKMEDPNSNSGGNDES
jgi:SEC-C motif